MKAIPKHYNENYYDFGPNYDHIDKYTEEQLRKYQENVKSSRNVLHQRRKEMESYCKLNQR